MATCRRWTPDVGDDPKLAVGVALALGLLAAFTVAMSIDVSRPRRHGAE